MITAKLQVVALLHNQTSSPLSKRLLDWLRCGCTLQSHQASTNANTQEDISISSAGRREYDHTGTLVATHPPQRMMFSSWDSVWRYVRVPSSANMSTTYRNCTVPFMQRSHQTPSSTHESPMYAPTPMVGFVCGPIKLQVEHLTPVHPTPCHPSRQHIVR